MPIKGMTDRDMSFPEIGKIRKGAEKQANRPGFDLKHFRVEFDEQEKQVAAEFQKIYGNTPDEINIVLPFNEINRCWDAWLEAYTAGRMVARADGEYFEYLTADNGTVLVKNGIDVETGKKRPYTDGQVVGHDNGNKPVTCKPSGRLKVVIPELQRLAFMTVLTTSINDIVNLSGQLEAIQSVNNGQLAGIPLKLRRRPKMISVPRDGKRVRMEKWLMSIEADPEYVKAKLIDLKQKALPGNGLHLVEGQETVEQLTAGEAPYQDYDDDEEYEAEIIDEGDEIEYPAEIETEAEVIPPAMKARVEQIINELKTQGNRDYTASPKQRQLLRHMIDDVVFADSTAHNMILKVIFGEASSNNITGGQVKAMLDWIEPIKGDDGDYTTDKGKALSAIMRYAMALDGQVSLFDSAAVAA